MATIFITHDLALAGQRSARIVVMHAGHVVENAPTADLFANPRHPYTAEADRATPDSAASLANLPPLPDRARSAPADCRPAAIPSAARARSRLRAALAESPGAAHVVACWNPLTPTPVGAQTVSAA